jgi:FkbM family methyltransferase
MRKKLQWLFTRPRALARSISKLGLVTTLQLIRIRMNLGRQATYALRVPSYPHPIIIRGGQSTDTWALYELLVMDEYALVSDLKSPGFIIDCGANIGIATVYFLNRYPQVRIVAVEPDPDNFEICRKNLAPYGDRVVLLCGAVWKLEGHLVLQPIGYSWNTKVRAAGQAEAGSVKAYTVPQLMAYGKGPVDLLKVDIEGSEKEVFGPGAQEWLPSVRNIVIELHDKQCIDNFFAAMEGYQYELISKKQDVVVCRNIKVKQESASNVSRS